MWFDNELLFYVLGNVKLARFCRFDLLEREREREREREKEREREREREKRENDSLYQIAELASSPVFYSFHSTSQQ